MVDLVVLRGFGHDNPQNHFGHLCWINQIRSFMATLPYKVNIVDDKRLLMAGSVLVDKVTGKITILPGDANVQVLNCLTQYNFRQAALDLLVTAFNVLKPPREVIDLHLQYDVAKYQLPRPLPLFARQMLRSRLMGEDGRKQLDMLESAGLDDGSGAGDEEFLKVFRRVLSYGMPCELCHEKGVKRCSKCKGAWYCSKEHQIQDWKSKSGHKQLCKELQLCSK